MNYFITIIIKVLTVFFPFFHCTVIPQETATASYLLGATLTVS